MKLKYCLVLTLLFSGTFVYSQKESKNSSNSGYNYQNEIGINFTNVLGNVLSLNPNNANSPYGMTYRKHYTSWTLRTGFDFATNNTTTFEFGDFFGKEITLNEHYIAFRIGAQKHIHLTDYLIFGYGLDFLANYDYEKSVAITFVGGSTFISDTEKLLSYGLGPVIRLEYKISDRIFLSTESTLYGTIGTKRGILEFGSTGREERSVDENTLKLLLPQSLFINISF